MQAHLTDGILLTSQGGTQISYLFEVESSIQPSSGVTFISINSDDPTGSGVQNAFRWGAHYNISLPPFWGKAPLTHYKSRSLNICWYQHQSNILEFSHIGEEFEIPWYCFTFACGIWGAVDQATSLGSFEFALTLNKVDMPFQFLSQISLFILLSIARLFTCFVLPVCQVWLRARNVLHFITAEQQTKVEIHRASLAWDQKRYEHIFWQETHAKSASRCRFRFYRARLNCRSRVLFLLFVTTSASTCLQHSRNLGKAI